MGAKPFIVTGQHELAEQLAHPAYDTIWKRAVEVFGSFELARNWMNTPLPILSDQTPEALARLGDPEKQKDILKILISIDYGMFD